MNLLTWLQQLYQRYMGDWVIFCKNRWDLRNVGKRIGLYWVRWLCWAMPLMLGSGTISAVTLGYSCNAVTDASDDEPFGFNDSIGLISLRADPLVPCHSTDSVSSSSLNTIPIIPISIAINTNNDGSPIVYNTLRIQYHDSISNASLNGEAAAPVTNISVSSAQTFSGIFKYTFDGNDLQFTITKAANTDTLGAFTVEAQPLPEPEPSNQPTSANTIATPPTTDTAMVSWTDSVGANLPNNYLVQCDTAADFSNSTTPTDNTAQSDDNNCKDGNSGVQNIAHGGSASAVWSGLDSATQYYFRIFAYSNSGTDIDYLTSNPATADATTTLDTPTVTTPSSAVTVNTASQTISGTHTGNGVTINLYLDANNDGTADNSTVLTSTTVSGNAWSLSADLTANGDNNFVVQAQNGASITSVTVNVPTITADSTAPTQTITITAISDDTGSNSNDFITKDNDGLTITATLSAPLSTGEKLEYSNDNGSTWSDISSSVSGTNISHTDSSLSGSNTIKMRVTDSASNSGTEASQMITIDATVPILSTLSPADDAIDIAINSNWVITLSENIVKGTGNILIKKASDDSTVESIDVTSGLVTINNAVVTINSNTALDLNTAYYVQIPETAFNDNVDNVYAGINDATSWSFTTVTVADSTPPTISTVSIPNSAMKIGDTVTTTITVNSDSDNYTAGNGAITGIIGGFTLSNLSKTNDTTYTATFTITDGGTDVASDSDIPISIKLTDSTGNQTTAFTTAISQNADAIDVNKPTLTEVTAVTTLTTDTTPDYTFSSTEAGTITYGGDCSSSTTSANNGNNTITFNTLSLATHSNCTITVTDAVGNASSALAVNSFEVVAAIAPDIDIQGRESASDTLISIATGDTSPRTLDGTDFGISNAEKTFTIENTGNADLTLSSASPAISLSSNSSSAFTISAQPNSTTIAAGTSTTFKINYTAQTGVISTATVMIVNNDSDEGTYSFNIQGGESSVKIPPRAEKLCAFVDGTTTFLHTFQNSGGNIKFAFDIVDSDGAGVDGAAYNYTWSSPNGALNTLLNGAGGTFSEGTVTSDAIDIATLSAGNYPMSVSVSDSTFTTDPNYVAKINFVLNIVTTAVSTGTDNIDSDGDGVVDANDAEPNYANNVPARLSNGVNYVSKVPVGYRVRLGTTASAAERTGLKVSSRDLSDHGNEGATATNTALSSRTVDHVFDYIVEGIAVPNDATTGNNATIVLPLESALTASSTFHKYSATGGWTDFVSDANNKIEWADWDGGVTGICPDPNHASYNNTDSQVGKTCLQITLQDGGANDQDGTVNGTLVDPFGIATPTPVAPPVVNTGGGHSGGGSIDPCASMGSITGSAPAEGTRHCNFVNYFVLSLEPALDIDATVDFQTRDGSAKAGEDYIKTSGTVTMKAGQTQLLIPVTIVGDTIAEDDESFALVLSNPTGATFPTGVTEIVTTHTIINSDTSYATAPAGVTAQAITTEGSDNQNHTNYFQLALDKAYDHDIIVSYHTQAGTATAGEDYIATSRKVKISAGQTKAMIGVEIIADNIKEADETFSLVISNPIGEGFPEGVSEITATHTILDDD